MGGENRDAQQTPVLFSGEHGTQILFSRDDEERDGVDLTQSRTVTDGTQVLFSEDDEERDGMDLTQSRTVPTHARVPSTPTFSQRFRWGELSGDEFVGEIQLAYEEMVHWRQNLFKIPSGRAGKDFTSEVTRLLSAFAEASALEGIALKAAMTLPGLMLQKPSATSKAKEHSEILERRLRQWREGEIQPLLKEGRAIQQRLLFAHSHMQGEQGNQDRAATKFAQQIHNGKTRAALRTLSQASSGQQTRILPVHELADKTQPTEETVLDVLKAKHPPGAEAHRDALLQEHEVDPPEFHPVIFNDITSEAVQAAALRCTGSAGPSGLDAAAWQRMCTAFKGRSSDLCTAIARLARRISTEEVEPNSLSAFTACRLIALDKQPGVRPIGVGEVLRRIVGKVTLAVVKPDILRVVGTSQLCAGQEGGCEAAVHAMRLLFADEKCEAALLVDASNAFNALNRKVALHNVALLCPSLATTLTNIYKEESSLYVDGEMIMSREGTTQGDPLAMVFYAIATLPLIKSCRFDELLGDVWFADDATGAGTVDALRRWWDRLTEEGPKYGYFPNAIKTWLVVKEASKEDAAKAFHGTGVQITSGGRRLLGATVGTTAFTKEYVSAKILTLENEIGTLAEFAKTQPHAAFSALTHGLAGKWLYLVRTIPDIEHLLQPLEVGLHQRLLPAMTGRAPSSDMERNLLALPARHGGLGIAMPSKIAKEQHSASLRLTSSLVRDLTGNINLPEDAVSPQATKAELRREARVAANATADEVHQHLPEQMQHARLVASEKGASSWLTALPIADHGFALPKGAFRDALCLRYGWPVPALPTTCVCGRPLEIDHALSCPHGGLPIRRHNEVRNLLASCMKAAGFDTAIEPPLQQLTGEQFVRSTTTTDQEARLDIKAAGFWGDGAEEAFFDVRVFNPFAPSYRTLPLPALYQRHERAKRARYEERVLEVERAAFTPLVFSASGGASKLATMFLKRLASVLAEKRKEPYSVTMAWLRTRLSFSLLRSAIACLRSSRRKFWGDDLEIHPVLAAGQAWL